MVKIKLLKISQFNSKDIFVGKIAYSQLKGKARSTAKIHEDDTAYQRALDQNKLSDVSKFLDSHKSMVAPFPTPLILATDIETEVAIALTKDAFDANILKQISDQNIEVTLLEEYFRQDDPQAVLLGDDNTNFLYSKDQMYTLYLPDKISEKIFIVDGQHRFYGFEKYIKFKEAQAKKQNTSFIEPDIDFAITFLLNYDIHEQAEVFANINFQQKPVNKSLYFAIFGVLPGRNKITFAHHLAKSVNESRELNGLIKMLGKGAGIVSLAFFVETIIEELVDQKGKIYNLQNEYISYKTLEQIQNEKLEIQFNQQAVLYKKLPQILIDYLAFYKDNFYKYFPEKILHKDYENEIYSGYSYKYYMFKAIGLFGILKIFNDLFEKNLIDIENYSKDSFYQSLNEIMKVIFADPEYFFNNSHMLKTASASLQKKFYYVLYEAIFNTKKIDF